MCVCVKIIQHPSPGTFKPNEASSNNPNGDRHRRVAWAHRNVGVLGAELGDCWGAADAKAGHTGRFEPCSLMSKWFDLS